MVVMSAVRARNATPQPADRRLQFNEGARVATPAFDRVQSRDQRRRAVHPGLSSAAGKPLDVFYNPDHSLTEKRSQGARWRTPSESSHGRELSSLKGMRMGILSSGAVDLMYNIDYSTQEKRIKGAVRIGKNTTYSPDKSYPFRRPASSAPRLGGVLGDAHPNPANRHCAAPHFQKQTTRAQRQNVGFTDRDPLQDAWNREQWPLNVKYGAVEPRVTGLASFSRQSSRSPDGPFAASISGDCYTDLDELDDTQHTDSERADVQRSFESVKRPLGRRIVGMSPPYGSSQYAHAQRPASRLTCGWYKESQNEAMYPVASYRRYGSAGVSMRNRKGPNSTDDAISGPRNDMIGYQDLDIDQ